MPIQTDIPKWEDTSDVPSWDNTASIDTHDIEQPTPLTTSPIVSTAPQRPSDIGYGASLLAPVYREQFQRKAAEENPSIPTQPSDLQPKSISKIEPAKALGVNQPFETYDTTPQERQQKTAEEFTKPTLFIPEIPVNPYDSKVVAAGKEVANILTSIPKFLSSPAGILTAGAGSVFPKTVATAFTAQQASQLGQQILDTHKNWNNFTPAQKTKAVVDAIGTGIFTGLGAKVATKGIAPKPEVKPTPQETPQVQSLVDESAKTLPLAAKAVDNIGAPKTPITEETSNASSQPSATGLPLHEVRQEVGGKASLQQQGEIAGTQGATGVSQLPPEQARPQSSDEGQVLLNQTTGTPNEINTGQENVQQDIRQQNSPDATAASTGPETAANSGIQPESLRGQGGKESEVLLSKDLVGQIKNRLRETNLSPEELKANALRLRQEAADSFAAEPDKANPSNRTKNLSAIGTQYAELYKEKTGKHIDAPADTSKDASNIDKGVQIEAKDHPQVAAEHPELLPVIAKDELKLDPKAYKGEKVPEQNKESAPPSTAQTPTGTQPVSQPESVIETPTTESVTKGVTDKSGNQPELVGMGGAVPSEFERGQGSPTAMKYRLIDQERLQRGLEPIAKGESVSDQEQIDKAIAAIDQNPALPDELVQELNSKPRPINDVENHVLLLRKIELRDAYEKSARAAAQAYEDSQQFPERKADLIARNIETARLSDKLSELENASRKSGSERGRALRSLRVMANEDFSLASLETQRRAAKGGEPLTDTERAELVKVADDYKKANDELNQHVADRDKRISELENEKAVNQLKAEAKQNPQYHPAIIKAAEKIVAGLDRAADKARQRIKERGFRFNTGVDPTVLLDVAEIGASYLGHAVLDFAKWSLKMKDEFGEGIEPYLKEIYAKSNEIIEGIKAAPAVKRAIKKTDFTSEVEASKTTIADKFSKNETADISGPVQKLAKTLIKNGITDREKLVDSVHEILKSVIPDITRRQTMDAISGYGDFKQLSKDEINVKLRGIKGELQQISKLEDMAKGVPPSKTGMERRTPTDAERALIKAVNEAKIKFQVPITDPATQLKSALDTRKTQLENQIKDYQQRLDEGNFAKKPRRELTLDRRAQELQAQKEKIAKEFKAKQRKYELQQHTSTEKVFDFIANARRFSVLSGVNVLGKLAAYSATKIPSIAATEAVGGAISKLPKISEIAAKAPSEGGLNLKAMAKAVASGLTQGFVDAYKTATTGSSDLKSAFSTRIETGREWYNFFQTIHEVIKSPLRRTAFELSLAKRMEAAARNGADITDPLTQVALAKDAYLDSDRALLLEQNRLASGIRGLLKQLESKDKATGQVPFHGKLAATAGRVELPILTVPFNYIKQTLTSAFGLVSGSIKARAAFKRGIDELSPQEADSIMRHLKYGSIGGALLLYGFYDGYKNGANGTFGGFYQPGEKRKDNQAGVNGIKIGDTKISGLFLHNPLIAVAQLGHTIGALAASKIRKKGTETHSIPAATVAGLMGMFNESPLGRTFELAGDLQDPHSLEYALGEHIKGLLVPQLVQESAQFFDKDKNGNPIKRKPVDIKQHIETGIPGLRQKVPTH